MGCGDARPHDWFTGIDIKAGTTGRGPNLLRDARNLSLFADGSQNYVFSSYLLNELPEWPKVLAEWWRLVKPDGNLVLFLPLTETSQPKALVDAMMPLKPWQLVDARVAEQSFFQVYKKTDSAVELIAPDMNKVCAVVKLGAHGDALWASSVLPHLKAQGFYVKVYTQETGESVLRHDPHIDKLVCFESRVPMSELGELFLWIEHRYKHSRILVECVEGTLLPSPQKIQYWFPPDMRSLLMNHNYAEMHHRKAMVPLEPRVKFYPSVDEKRWANALRASLTSQVVVLVPNGSSVSKMWPYADRYASQLLARKDVTVVMLGDERGMDFGALEDHKRFMKVGTSWDVRQAMTFCQIADVVVGQETGLLNCVSHEPAVHKIVLLSHSSAQNLTRDWPNTTAIRKLPPCAGETGCHRLHYDWSGCNQNAYTKAAECQSMISVEEVLAFTCEALDAKAQPIQAEAATAEAA